MKNTPVKALMAMTLAFASMHPALQRAFTFGSVRSDLISRLPKRRRGSTFHPFDGARQRDRYTRQAAKGMLDFSASERILPYWWVKP